MNEKRGLLFISKETTTNFFYVSCFFRNWLFTILILCNLKPCLFHPSSCSAITTLLDKLMLISSTLLFFCISCEYQILQVIFPHCLFLIVRTRIFYVSILLKTSLLACFIHDIPGILP